MKYKSKLHEWLRNTHSNEHRQIAHNADIKVHYLQRLSRDKVPDPGLFTVRRIVAAISDYNMKQRPDRILPDVTIEDI